MLYEGTDLLMELISKSKYIVALTGAGVSTSAGIPDFRGPQGIYQQPGFPGAMIFDINQFRQDPAIFYKHIGQLLSMNKDIQPTKGHRFLKKLEELGKLKTVVTQNIDGLHKMAGNSYVIEIHGNFESFYTLDMKFHVETDDVILDCVRKGNVPRACDFGGETDEPLKPNVVFFGEAVQGLEKALTEVQKADLIICMGTSLRVYPVAQLPSYRNDNAKLVIINLEPTPYDNEANLVIHADIDETVETLKMV